MGYGNDSVPLQMNFGEVIVVHTHKTHKYQPAKKKHKCKTEF